MTKVTFNPENYRIEIKGHAGYAPAGRDLVCASIGILSVTLINAATDVPEYGAHLFMDEKNAVIRVECCPEEAYEALCREMFRVIWHGFAAIEESYPDYIQLTGPFSQSDD